MNMSEQTTDFDTRLAELQKEMRKVHAAKFHKECVGFAQRAFDDLEKRLSGFLMSHNCRGIPNGDPFIDAVHKLFSQTYKRLYELEVGPQTPEERMEKSQRCKDMLLGVRTERALSNGLRQILDEGAEAFLDLKPCVVPEAYEADVNKLDAWAAGWEHAQIIHEEME